MQMIATDLVNTKKIYSEAWDFFKPNWWGVYKISLAAFVLVFIPTFILGILFGDENSLANFIGQIFSQFIAMGSLIIMLRYIRSKGTATFSFANFFANKDRFITYILANIGYVLVILLGMALFIIPGIIWSIKYMYAPMLTADKKLGAREAFDVSAQMTEGIKWKIFVFGLVGFLIVLGGLLLLGVGLFIAIPVVTLGSYMLYDRLLSRTKLGISQEAQQLA